MQSWVARICEVSGNVSHDGLYDDASASMLRDASHALCLHDSPQHHHDFAFDTKESSLDNGVGNSDISVVQPPATLLTQPRLLEESTIMSIGSKDHRRCTLKEVVAKMPKGVSARLDHSQHCNQSTLTKVSPHLPKIVDIDADVEPLGAASPTEHQLWDDSAVMSLVSKAPTCGVLKEVVTRMPSGIGGTTCEQPQQCHIHRNGCCTQASGECLHCAALANILDQEAFRHFWPLLDECRDYARLHGCRFHERSFPCVGDHSDQRQEKGEKAPQDITASLFDESVEHGNAQKRAAPMVHQFAERVRGKDPMILEELDKAFRIVMAESVRNAMIGTCKLLQLWPPSQALVDIAVDDCAFEDVTAPIPVIAQRLYNDESRRARLAPCSGDLDPLRRRAMMASFIIEFATAAGAQLPDEPETYDMMLKEFNLHAHEWEQKPRQRQRKQLRI